MQNVSQDESKIDSYFDDAQSYADMYEDGVKSLAASSVCTPEITVTYPLGAPFPRHIVIDFETTSCEGMFGHVRKGKIIVDQTNRMNIAGATRKVTYDNFSIDDFRIKGTRVVTSNDLSGNDNYQRTNVLTGGEVTSPDVDVVSRTATHVHEWIAGAVTPYNISDDIWKITGEASGIDRIGKNYTALITEALTWDLSCKYRLTKGIKTITTGCHVMVINHRNGENDNVRTISADIVVN